MTDHNAFMQTQARMASCLSEMLSVWYRWPAGALGRLDRFDKHQLRKLGQDMVRYGQAFIEEADRQDAEAHKERAA